MAEDKCSSCNQKSDGCTPDQCGVETLSANAKSKIKKVIAIMSGKGGVGKSAVTGLVAVSLKRAGYQVGILDADITGPSIPKMFGLSGKRPEHDPENLYPVETNSGIKVMSINLLLESEDQPVIWRGPVIAGAVKQFWTEVAWGELDYLVVDMPPGTGDVPLTVMQSLPLNGVIIVTSPQELANMVVKKAVNMAAKLNMPIYGFVENMSYLRCPDCGKEISIFGDSHAGALAADMGLRLLEKLPVDPVFAELCDAGRVEQYEPSVFKGLDRVINA